MKRMVVLSCLLILAGCRQSSRPPSDARLWIVASIFPVQEIVREIAGDGVSVFHLLPHGTNPHTYEPPPSLVRDLQGVDLFTGVHPEFDGWIARFLPPSAKILYLSEQDGFVSHSHHPETEQDTMIGDHGQPVNPHFWLSLRRVRAVVPILTDALNTLDPQSREVYETRSRVFLERLDTLDVRIRSLFTGIPGRRFIQWHPAWDDFAEDYGLEIIGTLEQGHGDEPSVRSFRRLIEKARNASVRVVVVDLKVESRAAEAIVHEIDGDLVRLDAIGSPDIPERSDYFRLMDYNAKTLAAALRRP
ncbi:MAG TPA: zinc ABC transporter substrate-binding protein [bacterium]|nr:zinc ABC transporter substrate-binding protein [bacterium]